MPASGATVTEMLDGVHRGRRTGTVEVRTPEGVRRLWFVDGELHLHRDHPLGAAVASLLAGGDPAAASDPVRLRELMVRIGRHVASWQGCEARFLPASERPSDLVGPLPTIVLLMEAAAAESAPDPLGAAGGEDAVWVAVAPRGEVESAAHLLSPAAAVLLSRLSHPRTVREVLRQGAGDGEAALADLVRLAAAGLARRPPERRADGPPPATVGPPVAPDVLRRYAERLRRDLEARPLGLDPEEHRSRVAALMERAGGATAYELLGVSRGATAEEIHRGYEGLARLVHPLHAGPLRLAAGEEALWPFFERVTAAYLILNNPERRRRYTRRLAMAPPVEVPAAQRDAEERALARSYYERARGLIDAEDFHFAIELLKQAVLTDPQPEYYAALGRAQAENPNWVRQAADSYRRALELGSSDPDVAMALGAIYEGLQRPADARSCYERALAADPDHPGARAALARLGGGPSRPGRGFSFFGRG